MLGFLGEVCERSYKGNSLNNFLLKKHGFQCVKKAVSESLGLVDFADVVVNSVLGKFLRICFCTLLFVSLCIVKFWFFVGVNKLSCCC